MRPAIREKLCVNQRDKYSQGDLCRTPGELNVLDRRELAGDLPCDAGRSIRGHEDEDDHGDYPWIVSH